MSTASRTISASWPGTTRSPSPSAGRPSASGRDRADKPEYKVKLNVACCFSNRVHLVEHYHNSSFLEHGGAPEKATRLAFVAAIDKYLRENNKYTKGESKITFPDVQDCLILVSNNFSTQTSYENQTKKAINNKFVQEAMTRVPARAAGGLLHREPRRGGEDRRAGAHQQAQPRDGGKDAHQPEKEAHGEDRHRQPRAEVRGLPHEGRAAAARSTSWRATPPSARASSRATRSFRG